MRKNSYRNKSVKSISSILSSCALVMGMGISLPAQAYDPMIGQIQTFGFNFPPRGWAFCDGQLLPIAQNTALFSLLGTTYGGDGRTTFALPDLRGRDAIHPGNGPGLSQVTWGQKSGVENVILTVNNMPAHSHTATAHASSAMGNDSAPTGNVMAVKSRTDIYSTAAPDVTMSTAAVTVANTGSNQAFSIRNPYLGIYHSIALVGIYPSRN